MKFTVKGKSYETKLSKNEIKELIAAKYKMKDTSGVTNEMISDYLANHSDEIEIMDLTPDTDDASSSMSKKAQKGQKNAKKILAQPRDEDGSVTVEIRRHGRVEKVRFSKERLATMEELYNNGNGSEKDFEDIQTLIRNMFDYGDYFDVLEWSSQGFIKSYSSNLEDRLGNPRFVVEGSSGIQPGSDTITFKDGTVITFYEDSNGRVVPKSTNDKIFIRIGGTMTTTDGKTTLIMHKQVQVDQYTGQPFTFSFSIKEDGKDTHKYLKVQDENGFHIRYNPGQSI